MKRVLLFLATNLAVMLLLSLVVNVLGLNRWMSANGIDYTALMVMCAVFGFGGAFISLLISKPVAKWSTGAHVIDGSEGTTEYWLVHTVKQLQCSAWRCWSEMVEDRAAWEGAKSFCAGLDASEGKKYSRLEILKIVDEERANGQPQGKA